MENVFKIATSCSRVRELLVSEGWDFRGGDEEFESFSDKRTGRRLHILDISDEFHVTLLKGELSLKEFGEIARRLTPQLKLLEVDSSWEGKQTSIVVAMTEDQVREMFGRRTRMRTLPPPRGVAQLT